MEEAVVTTPVEQRTFRRSESIGALAGALANAQGKMTGAKKDSANPFFKSKYADLASVWDAIRGPLSENGLAVMQFPRSPTYGVIEVETVLAHLSGEWVSETLAAPASQWVKERDHAGKTIGEPYEKFDVQTEGSAITYLRRYGLQSICGVAAEDDDGNAAAASTKSLRQTSLQALQRAAKDGLPALEQAWKRLSAEGRQACKDDLPGLKKEAAQVEADMGIEAEGDV